VFKPKFIYTFGEQKKERARAKDRVRLKISLICHAAGLLSWPEEKLICQLQINKVLFHFSTRAHCPDLSHCININYNFNPLCLLQIAERARLELILITSHEPHASFALSFYRPGVLK
jgi:hypothetical protein